MRPYIKTPVSKLNDARLHFVSIQAQRDYFMLYLLAGQLDADGLFIEHGRRLTDKEIAFRISTKPTTLKASINELRRERLIHINGKGPQIRDWEHEQPDLHAKRANDRERQNRHRHAVTSDKPSVTRDSHAVTSDKPSVTLLEEKESSIENRVLLLLSEAGRSKVEANPVWLKDAIKIAETKKVDDPEKYAAGILKNWVVEGRRKRSTNQPPKKSTRGSEKKPAPLRNDGELAAAKVQAKELLKEQEKAQGKK